MDNNNDDGDYGDNDDADDDIHMLICITLTKYMMTSFRFKIQGISLILNNNSFLSDVTESHKDLIRIPTV